MPLPGGLSTLPATSSPGRAGTTTSGWPGRSPMLSSGLRWTCHERFASACGRLAPRLSSCPPPWLRLATSASSATDWGCAASRSWRWGLLSPSGSRCSSTCPRTCLILGSRMRSGEWPRKPLFCASSPEGGRSFSPAPTERCGRWPTGCERRSPTSSSFRGRRPESGCSSVSGSASTRCSWPQARSGRGWISQESLCLCS